LAPLQTYLLIRLSNPALFQPLSSGTPMRQPVTLLLALARALGPASLRSQAAAGAKLTMMLEAMKRFMSGFACVISAAGFSASLCAAQSSLPGDWLGGYEIKGLYTPITVRLNAEGSAINGTLARQGQAARNALDQVRFSASNLHFELLGNAGALVFDGQLNGDLISGSIQSGTDRGTFHLVHSGLAKSFEQYLGDYEIGGGSYVSIWRFPDRNMFAGGVMYEVKTLSNPLLRMGYLFPVSDSAFVAGSEQFAPNPVEINATFARNERGDIALKWKPTGAREMIGKKVKLHFCDEEEANFTNGDVTLAGTLCKPLTKGRHAGVVMIDGSGGGLRGWNGLQQFFARHGIAALTYDKRGFGKSTGTIVGATVNDMAGDAAAGVRYLQQRADIDSKKVGVWAISQGGWMAPVVAATTPNVAFIILHAGPAVPPRVQARQELENTFPQRGFSAEEIKEAAAYQTLALDAYDSDEAYDRFQAAYKQAKARGARWVWEPSTKEQMHADWIRPNVDFDPVPVLEKVKVPVLAFFGEKDVLVPPSGNVSIMEAALKKAGNKDVTIKVIPGVGHMLWLPSGKTPPGYYDVMIAWLERHLALR
jgi:pimeloyl-ACP methyl ester carboxylesterase